MATINRITQADIDRVKRLVALDQFTLNRYQEIATKSAIYPGQGSPLGLAYVALKGCGEAGEFAEHVGKAMRDDGLIQVGKIERDETDASGYVSRKTYVTLEPSHLTNSRKDLLIKEIGDELWYLAAKCNELGISLAEAAETNLTKLFSRTERGKLQGSGDER